MEITIVKNRSKKGQTTMVIVPQGVSGRELQSLLRKKDNRETLDKAKCSVNFNGKSKTIKLEE